MMILQTMLMMMMMLSMARVTQSGSHLQEVSLFVFALFLLRLMEDNKRYKTLRFFCISLVHVCLSYFQCSDKWRERRLVNSSLASKQSRIIQHTSDHQSTGYEAGHQSVSHVTLWKNEKFPTQHVTARYLARSYPKGELQKLVQGVPLDTLSFTQ